MIEAESLSVELSNPSVVLASLLFSSMNKTGSLLKHCNGVLIIMKHSLISLFSHFPRMGETHWPHPTSSIYFEIKLK